MRNGVGERGMAANEYRISLGDDLKKCSKIRLW